MSTDLTAIVKQARGHRVLLVGDLILDRYVYGDAERISPEAPVPVLRVVERTEAVGGSGNVAACLQALGVETVVCGLVGDDAPGRRLKQLLTEFGADVSGVLAVDDRPTTTKTRLVGLAQHRHRQQLMRVDESRSRRSGQTGPQASAVSCSTLSPGRRGLHRGTMRTDHRRAGRRTRPAPPASTASPYSVDPGRISD
ncbi:MAG: hypothetical protein H6816_06590 [Phycisphaerales bacterium]|nr:hypothetical protein [Phycisphaerales bacterium]